jgi:hypothetical protein
MELIFLLIFVFFIFLNVVLGLVSSRAKKRKQMEMDEQISENKPAPLPAYAQKPSVGYDSFLDAQTAESIVKPLNQEPEKSQRMKQEGDYEGPADISEEIAPTFDETAPFPGGQVPAEKIEGEKFTERDRPFYQKREAELIESARQRADSRRQMVDLKESMNRVGLQDVDRKVQSGIESRIGKVEAPRPETTYSFGATGGSPAEQEMVSTNLWMRVQSLPALQKAVVLSEILGHPKGIKPHHDQR